MNDLMNSVNLDQLLEKYINNQTKLNELKGKYLEGHLNENQIIKRISEVSTLQREIYFENDEILKQTIFFYKNNLDQIDEVIYKKLQTFANELSKTVNQADTPIAYEIHNFLLEYAKKNNDLNKIIQESYYCGLMLYHLDSALFKGEILAMFQISEANMDKYFELDKSTREIFNRSYGNISISLSSYRKENYHLIVEFIQTAIAFWNREDIRNNDPDFKFDMFIFVVKRNMMVLIDVIRQKGPLDEETMNLLLQYSQDIFEQRKQLVKDTKVPIDFSYQYSYYAIRFHAGLIKIEELLDVLESLSTPIEDNLYSLESRSRVIRGGSYYVAYLNYANDSEEDLYKRKMETLTRINLYIRNMPISVYERLMQTEIVAYISSFSKNANENDAFNLLMELTIYRHLPTYIHIIMVSKIAKTILKYAIDCMPEFFVGMMDLNSVDEVLNSHETLMDIIEKSSLLHDIGKFFCLEYVSNYGRKLTDKEFDIIKRHPSIGHEVLVGSNIPNIYAEAALYHHVWHNDKGGYPMLEQTDQKGDIKTTQLIEIIALADSLDAATDYLGRPYARRKTLNELMQEFNEGAGTRYSPKLIKLLTVNENLYNELQLLINRERIKVTIEAYQTYLNRKENKIVY